MRVCEDRVIPRHDLPKMAEHTDIYAPQRRGTEIASLGRRSSVALSSSRNVRGTLSIPTVTLEVLGPIIQRYTVIDRPLPRELFAARPKQNSHDLDGTCVFARIGLFHDIAFRRFLNTQTSVRLRVLEPNLLPWDVWQSMLEVNAHIITKDHFLFNHRFGHFWANHYANDG
jgi:hypothetical protein